MPCPSTSDAMVYTRFGEDFGDKNPMFSQTFNIGGCGATAPTLPLFLRTLQSTVARSGPHDQCTHFPKSKTNSTEKKKTVLPRGVIRQPGIQTSSQPQLPTNPPVKPRHLACSKILQRIFTKTKISLCSVTGLLGHIPQNDQKDTKKRKTRENISSVNPSID